MPELSLEQFARTSKISLMENDHLFRLLAESLPVAVTITRQSDGRFLYVNSHFKTLFQISDQEILANLNARSFYDTSEDRVKLLNALDARQHIQDYEFHTRKWDGTPIWTSCSLQQVAFGDETAIFAAFYDITQRKEAEKYLEASEQRYKSLFEHNIDAVYSFDLQGRFLAANEACEAMCGYEVKELLKMSFVPLVVPEDIPQTLHHFELAKQGAPQHYELAIRHKAGHRVELNVSKIPIIVHGQVVGIYGISRDITARKTLEADRERLLLEANNRADCDPLTGLVNHRAFHLRLEAEIARSARTNAPLAVAVVDMDNFKFFNDAYGHTAGDEVLCQVGRALAGVCRPYDTLARYGGDEYALLFPNTPQESAEIIAERLRNCLNGQGYQPSDCGGMIPITLTVGMAIFPTESAGGLGVLNLADQRLRQAKSGDAAPESADSSRHHLLKSQSGFAMLDALVTAVDAKDRYTRRHSNDVLRYAIALGIEMSLSEANLDTLRVAALLHDVGKVGIPDAILRKPGKLTEEEFVTLRQYPVMGASIIAATPDYEAIAEIVRSQHERWDGSGYPSGLEGKKIPKLARLLSVADGFAAMTAERPYRSRFTEQEALSLLEQGAGTQWEPACVAAFLTLDRVN